MKKTENKKTTLFDNGLVWFGAGVSLAEILTGTYFAPLGFKTGILAIVLGHIIGCIMLFAAGIIGANTQKSAMETVKMSFGRLGGLFFSVLNIIQLVGWTAIMIYDGGLSAGGIFAKGTWICSAVIGVLIVVWIVLGIKNITKINIVAIIGLFVLSIILCKIIFVGKNTHAALGGEAMAFGTAVELAVAMPLSWLPLISDYTRNAQKSVKATAVSAVVYGIVSTWMYIIGMGAAIFAGTGDIAKIMVSAGLGVAGLAIIVFSTVTTTYLDAYSAGVSAASLSKRINEKWFSIVVTIIGTVFAIVYPMDTITDFLYLIGSVFAPMIAIQIADYFILHNNFSEKNTNYINFAIWIAGFIAYRLLMKVDFVLGSTLPDMVVTVLLCICVNKIKALHK